MSNPGPISNLESYLAAIGGQLNCRFTFEDHPDPLKGTLPWIPFIKDFVPDFGISTIDELVAKLDQELDGVKVVRSTTFPSVVHLIAEDLLQDGYVMDEHVTVEYSGLLLMLPAHLGAILEGKIGTRTFSGMPSRVSGDFTTEVVVDVESETVRDVLTGAVPLDGYRGFLWEASFRTDWPAVLIAYYGSRPTLEDRIASSGLAAYLMEMGDRLDCYFTLEDEEPSSIYGFGEFEVDLEVPTIDALVAKLDVELETVTVMRSMKYPSVVHLIKTDLLQEGYALEETVTLDYQGHPEFLPDELGALLDDRIVAASDNELPGLSGYRPAHVDVSVEDETVRDVLTGAVPLAPERRLVWQSGQIEVNGSTRVLVQYHGGDKPPDPGE